MRDSIVSFILRQPPVLVFTVLFIADAVIWYVIITSAIKVLS